MGGNGRPGQQRVLPSPAVVNRIKSYNYSVISAQDIPSDIGGNETPKRAAREWTRTLAAWAEQQLHSSDAPLLDSALPEFEKTLIETALSQTNGHRQEAAKLLGWGRNTLARKMKALHLD